MIFSDKFGMPTATGEYPAGATKEQQAKLLAALKAIQTDSAIIYPQGMVVKLLSDAFKASSGNLYERLAGFMNDEISKSVIGQTASVQGTPGKLGGDDSQENVRTDIISADADALCESLNQQVVRWVVDYNFPGVKRYPKMWIPMEEDEDLMVRAERDEIIGRNVPIPQRYWYETYGIPAPKDGELVSGGSPTPPKPGQDNASFSECSHCGPRFAEDEKDSVDGIADQAMNEADGSEMVDQVFKLLSESDSLEDARDKIIDLAETISVEDMAENIRDARLTAGLAGRAEIGEGQ